MGALFGGKKPEPPKAIAMPDATSPVVRAAEDQRRRQIMARSGRQSTILSRPDSGGAGTGAYKNSLLGQAG